MKMPPTLGRPLIVIAAFLYPALTGCILCILSFSAYSQGFLDQQRKTSRFITAEKEKFESVKELFKSKGVSFPDIEIYIRVFKNEECLEVWARTGKNDTFVLIRDYHICSNSGKVGPKRRQGDGQVPEGCYYINQFNPYSNFYLSLGLNYPNESDRILGEKGNLGGDIFIHGDCVTIGCIPLTDDYIKELYLICVYAKNNGQVKIPVHLFPLKLNDAGMTLLKGYFKDDTLISFWTNLQKIYNRFNETHALVQVYVDKKGNYRLK
jgi:murein L,D-transpeptidase YafK